VIVDDPDKKAVVADAYQRSYAPYIAAQREQVGARGGNSTVDRIMSSSGDQGWWGSVVPAIRSYMLAARARGLGTASTTLHLPFAAEVGNVLGLHDTVTQLACIPTAYHTGQTFKPADRRPAEEITFWNTWRHTDIA
jgi:nitroreductase